MTQFDAFHAILDLFSEYVPWIVLAMSRAFGFTMLFAVFHWVKLGSGMLRMAYALAISLPLLAHGIPGADIQLEMNFFAILLKELLIGALLGFASSIPLAIAIAGGGIIDFYRGAFQGAADPAGGQLTPFGNLFAILSLWLFAAIGGFQIITGTIYSSYDIWAVNATFPVFNPGADVLLNVLEKILLGSLVLAGPMLVIMFLSDIIHLISAKFGKSINIGHLIFSTKNLLAIMILPLFLVISIRLFKQDWEFLYMVPKFVHGIIA